MQRSPSVLIVDDSEVDRYLIRRLLAKSGVQESVFEAHHGVEAVDFLRDFDANRQRHPESFPPDIILLDINMPIMGGFEFLDSFAQLKAVDDRYSSIIFALLTSSTQGRDLERAQAYECVHDYVAKSELNAEVMAKLLTNFSV